jgi:hypothetical protein
MPVRKSLALITCFLLVFGGAPELFAQSSSAAITGVILDPAGKPASGFKVVFRDVASNTKFTSGPTDAAGTYAVQVPLGGRYKLDGVIADDGVTKLPVQEIPPISVLTPGTTRLNVRFAAAPAAAAGAPAAGAATAPAAAAASAPAAAPAPTTSAAAASTPAPHPAAPAPAKSQPAKATTTKAKAPWYKRPGPITGMVVGGVLILALAAGGGGGGGGTASQSTPSQ